MLQIDINCQLMWIKKVQQQRRPVGVIPPTSITRTNEDITLPNYIRITQTFCNNRSEGIKHLGSNNFIQWNVMG
jgi:hypothetical protein